MHITHGHAQENMENASSYTNTQTNIIALDYSPRSVDSKLTLRKLTKVIETLAHYENSRPSWFPYLRN